VAQEPVPEAPRERGAPGPPGGPPRHLRRAIDADRDRQRVGEIGLAEVADDPARACWCAACRCTWPRRGPFGRSKDRPRGVRARERRRRLPRGGIGAIADDQDLEIGRGLAERRAGVREQLGEPRHRPGDRPRLRCRRGDRAGRPVRKADLAGVGVPREGDPVPGERLDLAPRRGAAGRRRDRDPRACAEEGGHAPGDPVQAIDARRVRLGDPTEGARGGPRSPRGASAPA